mgnify:FL=1
MRVKYPQQKKQVKKSPRRSHKKTQAQRPLINNLRETKTLTMQADNNLLKTLKELERDYEDVLTN